LSEEKFYRNRSFTDHVGVELKPLVEVAGARFRRKLSEQLKLFLENLGGKRAVPEHGDGVVCKRGAGVKLQ
jgi:hypothetical protein